jgi:hypothetical protein
VSARVDTLIVRYHNGDSALAARRLGIKPELLLGLLSGDWRQFSLDALVAVIRTHGVTIDWLLGSTTASRDGDVPGAPLRDAPNMERERLL